MDFSLCDADEAARMLVADPRAGLTAAEASKRLAEDGANELRAAPARPLWRRVVAQFEDPIVYLLLVAAVVALAAWIVEGSVGWPVDALVIALVVLVNGAIGYAQEARAESAVAALARMTAATSAVLRDGKERRVPSADLVRGDILVLGEGDSVGADARLLSANALRVQEASLTGESEAVRKDPARLAGPIALGDRRNMVFKGTAVVQGTGRAVVTATGMRTEVGAIAGLLEATVEERTPLQKEISIIGRMLGAAVAVIAVVVVATILLVAPIRTAGDVVTVLLLGVSLAVAAVPEGLPAVLSVVLAIGVQRMSRRHAVVKRLSAVEALGSATVICSDKTGTLTRSEMTIQRVATASGASDVSGVGYVPEGRVEHAGRALEAGPVHAEHLVVLGGGSLASNADLRRNERGEWEIHGDPTEAAFLVAEHKLGTAERRRRRFERIAEVPFSADRKMMSLIARDGEAGGALVLVSKGAPDVLMQRCHRVRVGMDVLPFDAPRRARARADVDSLSDAALRTLAVAYRPLDADEDVGGAEALERDLIYVGTVGIIDPPREEAAIAVREARRAGIRVIMITGDHPRTAARIAADVGIVAPGAAARTGADLDRLDAAGLRAAVRETSVFARVAPAHKLRIVEALQAEGNVVAMTGDGVNDAPALKAADIGIAMGVTGTEVTKEAARMILADDNFATIVAAVREGRTIFDNIRKFLRYLLSSNMGEVLTVFLGVVGARVIGLEGTAGAGVLVLPLLATQVLWINLITDSAPALAMGVDPQTDDVMARPPRARSQRAIDARMWRGVVEIGVVMALVTLLTLDLYLPGGLIEGTKSLENARTAAFTVLVLAQLFNCFNARSETTSAFHRLFVNGWLWGAVVMSLLLQVAVVHVPVLNTAFGTVPLSVDQWAVCVAMASLVLAAGELRKLALRRAG
ncbi:MAG TPA: cation-translocating P-type ATPase [Caldimonas sp.]|nr:cation-translocating P-type ATPase [Caldimonas sp.]